MLGGTYGRVVCVLAGKGNNGADGLVAAECLRQRGIVVRVVAADETRQELSRRCQRVDLVIDAAYGTGFRGAWHAPEVHDAAVLAVDIPSGVDALTGSASNGALRADRTITFQALKPGLLFGVGAGLAGVIDVADIGIDVSGARQQLVQACDVARWWPVRPVDSHKWHGAVRVVAGCDEMPGAARLCAEAAARAGAGLVKLSVPGQLVDVRPEIVQHRLPQSDWSGEALQDISRFGALVVGPGLGRSQQNLAAAREMIGAAALPLVIDGDALFAIAHSGDGGSDCDDALDSGSYDGVGMQRLLAQRTDSTVLTPHGGEFEVLAGHPAGPDRVESTRQFAAQTNCTVLLKGPTTVVAEPNGEVLVVDRGDQRLATAGTGDVLAGMIGAALASAVAPLEAAAPAAWLHAESARVGPAECVLAGDLIDNLPRALAGIR
jgi:NAD(P)H-hydrate epimerase